MHMCKLLPPAQALKQRNILVNQRVELRCVTEHSLVYVQYSFSFFSLCKLQVFSYLI